MRRRAVVAVAVAALLVPTVAHAHPRLLGSKPAAVVVSSAPSSVSLRFSEDVDPVGAGVTVTGPNGRDVTTGPVEHHGRVLQRSIDAHVRGTYVVEWLAVGSDTHPARGAFLFSVGDTSQATAPGAGRLGVALQATGRWLSLLGYTLGFGVPFAAAAALGGAMTPRLWRLVGAGIGLMVVAEPVSLLGQTATLEPGHPFSARLAGDVLLTSYGHATGLRLGAALGLWALAGAVRQASARALWAVPALGAVVALVHADAAHRIGAVGTGASLGLVAVHVAAAGAWLGCIVVAVAGPDGSLRTMVRPAATAACIAVSSGLLLAVGHLRSLHELLDAAYGVGVLVKLAVVVLALVLAVGRRHRAELAVGLTALAAAATLVSLLPPV